MEISRILLGKKGGGCSAEELDQSGSGVLSQSPGTHSSEVGMSVVKLENERKPHI